MVFERVGPLLMKIKLIAVCFMMIVSSTGRSAEPLLDGKIVYASANSVYVYDIANQKTDLLYESAYGDMIDGLSRVDEKRILFHVFPVKNEIFELNTKTRAEKKLRNGSHPLYIPEHGVFFFYDRPAEAKQLGLYVAQLNDPIGSQRLVDKGPYVLPQQVIPVSRDEVVFLSGRNGHSQDAWKYNIVTEKLEPLPISNCRPQLWRTATNELLCLDLSTGRQFFSDLTGHKGGDFKINIVAAMYIPGHDVLIGGKRRFSLFRGEISDMWIYDFRRNRKSLLLENAPASLGSVTWFN